MGTFRKFLSEENSLISEASLSRILKKVKFDKKDFGIITSYRDSNSEKENIKTFKQLQLFYNSKKMGGYVLIGHWQECQDDNIEYENCPKDQLVDVIEKSLLVVKPDEMEQKEFEEILLSQVKKYNQDSAIISIDGEINLLFKDGKKMKIGDKVTMNKISQAYSQYIKKQNVPFVFEGIEQPNSISARRVFKEYGQKYDVSFDAKKEEYKTFSDLVKESKHEQI